MRKSRQNKGRRTGRPQRDLIPHPPPISSYAVTHGTRLRFVANSAFAASVTFQNLLDTILVATSATAVYDLFHTVKIRSVEVWAVPVLGNAATVEVVWSGSTAGSAGSQKVQTDTSMGIEPAHVRATPGRQTLASLAQASSAAVAFSLNVPSGAVIDVELTFKNNPGSSVIAQNVAVAATVGEVGYRGLDGLAAAGTKLTPAVAPAL